MKLTRTYTLRVYPNFQKSEGFRYTYTKYLFYVNDWSSKLFKNGNKSISTAGLGQLANQAQHRARGVVRGLLSLKANGHVDKKNRSGRKFHCGACGHKDHADANAAKVISSKGTSSLAAMRAKRSGGV